MSFPFRVITDASNLAGRRVLVRASLDVPIVDGVVTNEFRIRKALPTIEFLRTQGAKVIIMTHVGRGATNTAEPLFHALSKYVPLTYTESLIGTILENEIAALGDGEVMLIGNLRAHPGEETNDVAFARELASFGDVYVNDAFAVSHRAHASIVGVPALLPAYAGITFADEYEHLSQALAPEHPSLFIIGGAKFETKEPLIDEYADHYTNTFIGGALANDFLKARGCRVGSSLLSPVDLSGDPLVVHPHIITPRDVIAVHGAESRTATCADVLPEESILDVGMETIRHLAPYIENAKTILWNGPLGNYEKGYDAGTKACAELIAKSDSFSIVGGGDTVAAIESLGLQNSFGFLSTAGGAMLEFLEKKTLPGIEAITSR